MFGNPEPRAAQPGDMSFHPMHAEEYRMPQHFGQALSNLPVRPIHEDYLCGACGKSTNGRVLCHMFRKDDNAKIQWCMCSCEREEPSLIITRDGKGIAQFPIARHYHAHPSWPADLATLYDEAAKSYSAGAFTATTMVCRKILMVCASHEGDTTSKNFQGNVEFITNNVLNFPKAKAAIDAIRTIGNEANHEIQFIAEPDAKRAMDIVTYMLNTIYALPAG
jgi:hypothetical protein